jgi:hypothetical protein
MNAQRAVFKWFSVMLFSAIAILALPIEPLSAQCHDCVAANGCHICVSSPMGARAGCLSTCDEASCRYDSFCHWAILRGDFSPVGRLLVTDVASESSLGDGDKSAIDRRSCGGTLIERSYSPDEERRWRAATLEVAL